MRRTSALLGGLAAATFALTFAAGATAADAKATVGLRYPTLAPDGQWVAFDYRGDIWRAPIDGKGHADRLTIHDAQDTLPRVVGSSRVDLQACKLEYSIVSPK